MSEPRDTGPSPYTPPRADIAASLDGGTGTAGISRDEARAYVGPKGAYYWGAWQRARDADSLSIGFNWAAAIFTLAWLLYRKMYREFFLFAGATMGVMVVVGLAVRAAASDAQSASTIVELALAGAMGALGNGLYLRSTRRAIAVVHAEVPDEARRVEALMLRGGTTRLAPAIAIAISMALGAVLAR